MGRDLQPRVIGEGGGGVLERGGGCQIDVEILDTGHENNNGGGMGYHKETV